MGDEAASTQDDGQGQSPHAAPHLALGAAGRERADAYLAEQTELTRLQIERERKDERLHDRLQRVGYASAILKLAFEFVVALLVIVVGAAVGAALWSAAHANGVVVESFSVPPDLAGRGLTGEVVAAKVLDRLTALQAQTASSRAGSSYANDWGTDIKVQIPETGVSIGDLYRYLTAWLGHETHISGEIWRDGASLAVTARVAGDPAATVRGADADLDKLVQRAAEAVYRRTQPYRYAVYLDNHGRRAEASALYNQLIAGDSQIERAWAYIGLSSQANERGDFAAADAVLAKAAAINPDILLIWSNIANNENSLQHDEPSLAAARHVLAIAARGRGDSSMDRNSARLVVLENHENVAQAAGDFAAAQADARELLAMPDINGSHRGQRQSAIVFCAARHDRACYEAALDAVPPDPDPQQTLQRDANIQLADLDFGDWRDAVARSGPVLAALKTLGPLGAFFALRAELPLVAFAQVELGDFAAARAAIEPTPLDCVQCLRMRGRLAARQGDWKTAERWFARAAALAPSIVTSYSDWGEMLLRRGDAAGAIAKFAAAHKVGPRFADALEMWGEALIAQNRSDLALAKFEEAARYAPNWGRLHLKWGEALLWSGDAAGAHAQFAAAAALFLAPRDKAQLARVRHG